MYKKTQLLEYIVHSARRQFAVTHVLCKVISEMSCNNKNWQYTITLAILHVHSKVLLWQFTHGSVKGGVPKNMSY